MREKKKNSSGGGSIYKAGKGKILSGEGGRRFPFGKLLEEKKLVFFDGEGTGVWWGRFPLGD